MSNAKSTSANLFGPVIFAYTRAQAIADGVLVDLTQPAIKQLLTEAGVRPHTAMTIGAWSKCVCPVDRELPESQDINGRLWDVLMLFRHAIGKNRDTDRVHFTVSVFDGKRQHAVKLWALIGPGDEGEPVLTVMLEGED